VPGVAVTLPATGARMTRFHGLRAYVAPVDEPRCALHNVLARSEHPRPRKGLRPRHSTRDFLTHVPFLSEADAGIRKGDRHVRSRCGTPVAAYPVGSFVESVTLQEGVPVNTAIGICRRIRIPIGICADLRICAAVYLSECVHISIARDVRIGIRIYPAVRIRSRRAV